MSEGVIRTAAPSSSSSHLQNILQRAVQTVNWTYIIYWKLCPLQRILVWSEGYYNGEIKTRKTVQLKEVSAEEASLQRSQQLRELYETLCAAETNPQTRRPSAALSPEDLTESEWFYLLCFSYYFPPAVGLPGRAYARRQYVWLTGANEVDSHIFSRAILAKSAEIQTVVCIPLLDGVVELGTTQKVPEDLGFIQRTINIFIQSQESQVQKPALSDQSTSNPPPASGSMPSSTGINASPAAYITISPQAADTNDSEKDDEAEEEGGDEEDDSSGDSDTLLLSFNDVIYSPFIQNPNYIPNEDIRIESIDGGSNDDMDLDYEDTMELEKNEHFGGWQDEDPQIDVSPLPLSTPAQKEDTYYSQTVEIILQGPSSRCSDISSTTNYVHHSPHSAFFMWSSAGCSPSHYPISNSSQRKLKYILYTVPVLHSKDNKESKKSSAFNRASRFHKSGTHQNVLAERRRREKLNEHFITLRSLVPFVTKMDKASILGDTINYVKQLREKIQEVEARVKQTEGLKGNNNQVIKEQKGGGGSGSGGQTMIKKKMRLTERGSGGGKLESATGNVEGVRVEVSITENIVLVKLQCRHREGLLLDIMQILRLVRVEIIAIQSSLSEGVFMAELRAKVKENLTGKKVTMVEVKNAILQTVS